MRAAWIVRASSRRLGSRYGARTFEFGRLPQDHGDNVLDQVQHVLERELQRHAEAGRGEEMLSSAVHAI